MKIFAVLNPENGTCKETLFLLYNLLKCGNELKGILLVLENTYHAEKWVISLSMPLSKEEIEQLKEKYRKKILSEWEALTGKIDIDPVVVVDEAHKALKGVDLSDVDLILLGCLENKSLCKLIENLDKPVLAVKN